MACVSTGEKGGRFCRDASVLAHVVVSKKEDHCPLHRLHRIYLRGGVDIPVSTMSDWMGEVGDLFQPLADRILSAYIDQMDATGVKVLDPISPENIERGTMWCYVGDERDVVFRYTPTEKVRPVRGVFWQAAPGMFRQTPPTCSIASSTARRHRRSRSGVGPMDAESWPICKIWTAASHIR
jgi:hypothetical protein